MGSSLLGVQGLRGQKRPSMAMAFSEFTSRGSVAEQSRSSRISGGAVEATLCRPWDRGDLHKRLATFKSMTWFAKPEVWFSRLLVIYSYILVRVLAEDYELKFRCLEFV